jgi:hypothetical protein
MANSMAMNRASATTSPFATHLTCLSISKIPSLIEINNFPEEW